MCVWRVTMWIHITQSFQSLNHPSLPRGPYCFCAIWYATARIVTDRRLLFTWWIPNHFSFLVRFWQDLWSWFKDYPIKFWSIVAVPLALNFQGQIFNLLYLSQKSSDRLETKSKYADRIMSLKCNIYFWPWPWPWPWFYLLYLSQKWSDCHETTNEHINWMLCLKCVLTSDMTFILDFQGQISR